MEAGDFFRRFAVYAAMLASQCALAAPTPGSGPDPDVCSTLLTLIDNDKKTEAAEFVSGAFDDSAPRATLRASKAVVRQQRAAFNLRLMELNKCRTLPPPMVPEGGEYLQQAFACHRARTDTTHGDNSKALCDSSVWRPYAGPPVPTLPAPAN